MPHDPFWDWMLGILWAMTAVFMAWTWIPAILSAIGKTRFTNYGNEDLTDMEPTGKESTEPEYVMWFLQLKDLGFEPLGQGWMRVIEAGPRWMIQSQIRVFFSRTHAVYAILQRERAPLDAWYSLTMASCMTDGGLVLNSNFAMKAPVIDAHFLSGGIATWEASELLAYHQAIVANEKQQYSRRPEPDGRLDLLLSYTQEYFDQLNRFRFQKEGRQYLISEGLMHLCVSLPAWYAVGAEHWALPLSNLVLYGALRIGEYSQNRVRAEELVRMIRLHAQHRLNERTDAMAPIEE